MWPGNLQTNSGPRFPSWELADLSAQEIVSPAANPALNNEMRQRKVRRSPSRGKENPQVSLALDPYLSLAHLLDNI